MTDNILMLRLPRARFNSVRAIEEFEWEAGAYERAIAGYEAHRDDLFLHQDLTSLGFDREEIAWHVINPGKRMPILYRCL